ncbi:MAG TPA: hypothetical protein DIT40_05965 [Alphaproteobacteria bacterium]|nr:hypothetical protein [Alphaproteobacteria bacterium]
MGNQIKGRVDFECGAVTYSLQFTANGLCELESEAGCSAIVFLKKLDAAGEDLNFSDIRLLFWAGLQEHHPDLTLRDAGRVITDLGGLEPAMTLVEQAVTLAFPDAKAGGSGTGKRKGSAKPKARA